MIMPAPNTLQITNNSKDADLKKGSWLVILNATRTPPHVGLMFDGNYNSLTIKGHELNVDCAVLLKMIHQKKIPAVFCKLKPHPVFSTDFQREICQHYIRLFKQVKANEASCLSPIKLYFQEFYALTEMKSELLYELIERLKFNNYIAETIAQHVTVSDNYEFSLPVYSNSELQDIIQFERAQYYKE
ncbi:MAG: hypothetical protein K0R26_2026 [Bacteroidota bacterium]|jgi:hypothetical protein|nr:hypothetical protein [Bacteroidota bacterium]